MKTKFLAIMFVCLFNLNNSFSQVNIESFREEAKKEGFYGSLNCGIQLQKGNVNSQAYELKKDLHYKYNKHHILLKSSVSKGYQDKILYRNNAFSHFRYTIMLHNFIGYEIFTQTQYDEFKDLSLRQLNGVGIRIEKVITKTKIFKFAFGTGIMSDYEQISYETTMNARITSYMTIIKSFVNDNSSFISITSYYQPLLLNYKDYRVNNEVNLRSSILKSKLFKLGINTSFAYLHDSEPAVKIKKSDIIFKTGIAVIW